MSRVRYLQLPWGPYVAPGSGRDERIDLLRGFAVVAMVVDHIAGPSWLYSITGGNRFYTSAAEGFIFISGLVMGLVYQRLIERDGVGPSLWRALALYLITVTLTFFFVPTSELLGLHWAQGVDFRDPAAFIVSVLTLHRTYYLVDIPLLYTLLLLVSPTGAALAGERQDDPGAGRLLAAVAGLSVLPGRGRHALDHLRQLPLLRLRLAGVLLHRPRLSAGITGG